MNENAVGEKVQELSPEEARRVIAAERDRRVRACLAEIQAALQRHGCEIVAQPAITADGRIETKVELVQAD